MVQNYTQLKRIDAKKMITHELTKKIRGTVDKSKSWRKAKFELSYKFYNHYGMRLVIAAKPYKYLVNAMTTGEVQLRIYSLEYMTLGELVFDQIYLEAAEVYEYNDVADCIDNVIGKIAEFIKDGNMSIY